MKSKPVKKVEMSEKPKVKGRFKVILPEAPIEAITSDDPDRPVLANVFLSKEGSKYQKGPVLFATDGKAMAVVPAAVESQGDWDMGMATIPQSTIKAVRAVKPKYRGATIIPVVEIDEGDTSNLVMDDKSSRPLDYSMVMPEEQPSHYIFALDAGRLYKLAKALTRPQFKGDKRLEVVLHFPKNPLDPCMVNVGKLNGFGVLMPCRIG